MYTPPEKTRVSLSARCIHLVWTRVHKAIRAFASRVKRVRKKGYTRLRRVWSACARNCKRVCYTCETRSLGVWNAFTRRVKCVSPARHTCLLYTLRLVGTVACRCLCIKFYKKLVTSVRRDGYLSFRRYFLRSVFCTLKKGKNFNFVVFLLHTQYLHVYSCKVTRILLLYCLSMYMCSGWCNAYLGLIQNFNVKKFLLETLQKIPFIHCVA